MYRRAKGLFRVICCEVGKIMFPDDPHTWGHFFDSPDSVDKKYTKILNNTLDLFILGHPIISHSTTYLNEAMPTKHAGQLQIGLEYW